MPTVLRSQPTSQVIQHGCYCCRVNPCSDAEDAEDAEAAANSNSTRSGEDDDGDGKPGISLTELLARGPTTSLKDRAGNTALHVMVRP